MVVWDKLLKVKGNDLFWETGAHPRSVEIQSTGHAAINPYCILTDSFKPSLLLFVSMMRSMPLEDLPQKDIKLKMFHRLVKQTVDRHQSRFYILKCMPLNLRPEYLGKFELTYHCDRRFASILLN